MVHGAKGVSFSPLNFFDFLMKRYGIDFGRVYVGQKVMNAEINFCFLQRYIRFRNIFSPLRNLE